MAQVTVQQLTKTFGARPPVVAADALDLDIEDGEFLVLLGPSGCGKTTTLRCLAGLEQPDEGRILIDGEPVFDHAARINRSPDRRSIGMVFQSYALWPHLNVRKNIEYPLKARKIRQGLAEDWVGDVARLVECEYLLDRLPSQLSGGQQQRIALARGLVARPGLMLFDEPLSNLDAKLRDQVRTQLHELHRRLGFTAVFVTHDQAEAFALADRLVILQNGRIEQFDTARTTWHQPASDYVAEFIGMSNRIELHRSVDGWSMGGGQAVTGGPLPVGRSVDHVVARLRPDDLGVARPGEPAVGGLVSLTGSFVDSTFGGDDLDVTLEVDGQRVQAHVGLTQGVSWIDDLEPGTPVSLRFRADLARYFDPADGTPAAPVPGNGGRHTTSGPAVPPRPSASVPAAASVKEGAGR